MPQRFAMVEAGYVVMPEHFPLLVNEPSGGALASGIQVQKQTIARALVTQSEDRPWPSFQHYATGHTGTVFIFKTAKILAMN